MSSYDFILDGIVYSYSSLSSYETCNYGFKLTYIDMLPRESNFFGEYGSLIHECNEKYFSKELDYFELSSYYLTNYDRVIKTPSPSFPSGMEEKYKQQGLEFYDNFYFDRNAYNIIAVELKTDLEIAPGLKFTARPDLVLKSKETNKISLYDYKTSAPFKINKYSGKETSDTKKLEGYYKQMFLYSYCLSQRGILIDEITLWFTRPSRFVTILWEKEKEDSAINWAIRTFEKIKKDTIFSYNNSSKYFCDNLCGVRNYCKYR